jgi:hypothetical protein
MTLQHWSKWNDNLTAEVGNNWALEGTGSVNYQSLPIYGGNGILSDGAANATGWGVRAAMPAISMNLFSLSFVWRPNQLPATSAVSRVFGIESSSVRFYIYKYDNAGPAINVYMTDGGPNEINYTWSNSAITAWTDATSVLKVGFVVDTNAAAGQKVKLYVNNTLISV